MTPWLMSSFIFHVRCIKHGSTTGAEIGSVLLFPDMPSRIGPAAPAVMNNSEGNKTRVVFGMKA